MFCLEFSGAKTGRGVTDVRAEMIARSLKTESVAFSQGVPDVTGVVLRFCRVGSGSAAVLIALLTLPTALKDLDNGFDGRIVVAPIGSHASGAGVRRTNATEVFQALVEQFGIGSAGLGRSFKAASRQRPNTSLRHDDVSVPVRIDVAALVAMNSDKMWRIMEKGQWIFGSATRCIHSDSRCRDRRCPSNRGQRRRVHSASCLRVCRRRRGGH
ncbi:MAG: hypothetical protein KatS3mg105_4783 [Gemmatales bacterium]|nr:MAG: hypothetical protein KatS3mg105_4783 [Gemmatales bacterium]